MKKKIISTRPLAEDDKIKNLLESKGAFVIDFPMIQTKCIQETDELLSVLKKINNYNWIIFTSKNGALCLYQLLQKNGFSYEIIGSKKFAVIGKATAEKVQKLFGKPAFISSGRNAEDLLLEIRSEIHPTDKALLVLGELADNKLEAGLQEHCSVTRINTYQTCTIEQSGHPAVDKIIHNDYDLILFTSPSGFRNFHKIMLTHNIKEIKAACIGTTTEAEMQKFGFKPVVVSPKSDAESFVNEIEKYFASSEAS
ncbi:MAG: uroporphyrinogen-III synthase [Paludibacter sp.]|nr:uroporphyrinogen-III synthase [Paludibacter sp.]